MSSQLNPQQVAAWRAAMNAYLQGNGPQPNWYNYFTVGQTQAFESGNTSVSSSSQNSTPNKVSAALNTQESQNDKVIADQIRANISSNTDLAAGATKQQAQPQPQQPQSNIITDFGNAAKTTTTLKITPPPPPVVTPGPETPQSKGLNLGQAALSGNETKTPILGSGSMVKALSDAIEISTPTKTPINTPSPAPAHEVNFVSTNPTLRNAILQERETSPSTFQNLPSNYLQGLISKGVLSENDVYNTIQPTVLFAKSTPKISTPTITTTKTAVPSTTTFVSTNPILRTSLLQERETNPNAFQTLPSNYLQGLIKQGVLSNDDVFNTIQPTVLFQVSKPAPAAAPPKSSNPKLESELVSDLTAHPENYVGTSLNFLTGLQQNGTLLQSDIDKINSAFTNYNKAQTAKQQNFNTGISTNAELENAILEARTSNPGAFANISTNYVSGLENKGVITKPDVTILNNSVSAYNKQIQAANQPFKSTNEGLRESILQEYATNPSLKVANAGNYLLGLEKKGVLSYGDILTLQPWIVTPKTPLPKLGGVQSNPIGEFIKGSNIEINEYLTQAKGFYNYIVSGGKDNNIPSSTDIVSKAISAPIEAYQESNEYGVPYSATLGNQGQQILTKIQQNPARAMGQLLPTAVLSLIPVGDIAVGVKNTVPFLKSLLTGSTEANTAREIVGDVISKPVTGIGRNGEQVITKVPAAPYSVEKTAIPGVYRFYVGSGNDVVETGKELTPVKGLPVSTKYSPPPESTLVKATKEIAPTPKPSYVAAGVLDLNKGTVELYTPETTITKTIPNKIVGTGNVEPKELQLMRATKINNNAFEITTKSNPSVDEAADIMPKSTYVHPTTLTRINEAIESGNAKITGTGIQFDLESFQKYPNAFKDFIISGPTEKTVLPEPSAVSKIIAVKRFGAGAARGTVGGSATSGGISVGGKGFDDYLKSLGLNPGTKEAERTIPGSTTPGKTINENGQAATKTLQEQVKEITTPASNVKPSLEIPQPLTGTIPAIEITNQKQETTTPTKSTTKSPGVRNLYKGISRLVRIKNSNPSDVINQDSTLKQISKSNTKMINDLSHLPGTDLITIPDLEESTKKKTGPVVDLVPLGKMEDLTKLGTMSKLNKKQSDMPGLDVTPKNIPGLKNVPKLGLIPGTDLTTIPKMSLTPGTKLDQVPALKIPTPQPELIPVPTIPETPTGGDIIQPFKFKKLGDFGFFGEGSRKKGSKVHVFYDVVSLGNVKYSEREFRGNPFRRRKKKNH